MQLKHIARRAAQAIDCTLIPNWRLASYPQAEYLRRLFAHLAIDCVFDVGANAGQYRDFLRSEVGYAGIIVSFEPIPDHVLHLRQRAVHDEHWYIEDFALGAESGQRTFNIMARSTFSSFLQPDPGALARYADSSTVVDTVDVTMRTLAEMLPALQARHGFRAPYLKLDTQGFDLEVLRGAGESLQAIQALQTEASIQPIYAGMPGYQTTIDWLQAAGFVLSGIYPNNETAFPVLVEVDCHMLRRDLAGLQ